MFSESDRIAVYGRYLGERLDVRHIRNRETLGISPLTIRAGRDGCAVLFRYGVAVTFNLTEVEREELTATLSPHLSRPFHNPESEPLTIGTDETRAEILDGEGILWLQSTELERLQVVAEVLAKSIVLAHYEGQIARAFERLEPLAEQLASGSRPPATQKTLLTELGEALLAQTRTIGRVETGDKPGLVWDDPSLDRLYVRLAREYELGEREAALSRKTALVSDTTGLFIDLLAQRQTLRVEWYIVILILIEIVLILYDLFILK